MAGRITVKATLFARAACALLLLCPRRVPRIDLSAADPTPALRLPIFRSIPWSTFGLSFMEPPRHRMRAALLAFAAIGATLMCATYLAQEPAVGSVNVIKTS